MKTASSVKPAPFNPITVELVLETQEEVDRFWAVHALLQQMRVDAVEQYRQLRDVVRPYEKQGSYELSRLTNSVKLWIAETS